MDKKKLFVELVESMTVMGKIVRGERAPSCEFFVGDAEQVAGMLRPQGRPFSGDEELTWIEPNAELKGKP